MTLVTDFQAGVSEALKFGEQVSIKYYNTNVLEDGYDDDVILTQSGTNLWISGVVLPITNARGSSDAILLEQGKILTNDTKLYIEGTVSTSGVIKIGLGSPIEYEYSLLSEGVTKWEVNDIDILKKLYLRRLTTGSLIGE